MNTINPDLITFLEYSCAAMLTGWLAAALAFPARRWIARRRRIANLRVWLRGPHA